MALVKYAETEAEKEAAYHLRYQIYVEEMGKQYEHKGQLLVDESDENTHNLIAIEDNEIIGTLRIHWGADAPFGTEYEADYDLSRFTAIVPESEIMMIDHFVVKPEHRGGSIPFQLILNSVKFGLDKQCQLAFCGCKPHLLNLYLGLGFRTYAPTYDYESAGLMVPLIMVIEDLDYFRKISSPLLGMEQGYEFNSDVPNKVLPLISQSEAPIEMASEENISHWEQHYDLLTESGNVHVSMFQDMSEEDVAKVLHKSYVIKCQRGDHVIMEGKTIRTIFVILSGVVEVRVHNHVKAVLTEGDVIGELSFLTHGRRTADVIAASKNVHVLSLREKTIRSLMDSEPKLAAQLMYNLAQIVSQKLIALQ
jgi:predicted GNAT family N-acyltransferase